MVSIIQPSFTGGELSPNLFNRVDMARWHNSVATMRNFEAQPYGGTKNRSGFRFVAEVKDSSKHTICVPFKRSSTVSFVLEFGDLYVRVYKNGGATHLAEVATPYTSAQLDSLCFSQSVDVMTITHPDHQNRNLSRTSDTTWTLAVTPHLTGPWLELNTDSSVSVMVSAVVGNTTVLASAPLFNTAEHVGRLIYIEQKGYGQPWEVGKDVVFGDIRRSDGKYYEVTVGGKTGTLRPVNTVDIWSDGGVSWRYLHSGYGIAVITKVNSTTSADISILSRMPTDASSSGTGFGTPIPTAGYTLGATADGYVVIQFPAPHGITPQVAGTVRLTSSTVGVTSAEIMSFTDTAGAPSLKDITLYSDYTYFDSYIGASLLTLEPPLSSNLYTTRFKFSAWGATQGWPGLTFYYQGRRGYAASTAEPRTVWMSRSNAYNDFSNSVPLQDDDALTFTLASSQFDDIKGAVPMSKLIILTAGANWALGNGRDDVATPGNLMPSLQGFRGSAPIAPLSCGDSTLFIQDKGSVIRDLEYDLAKERYAGQDLTVFADHLFEGKSVVGWCFQQHPFGIVWAVRNDGELLGLTYLREQQIAGWHHHDTALGLFKSVCCVPEGGEDVVYAIVQRTINGATKRYLERKDPRLVTDVRYGLFTDSALSYDGSVKTAASLGTDHTATTMTVTGGTNWDETEQLTVTSSAAIFVGAGDINDGLFYDGFGDGITYRLTIESFVSTTQVKVRPSSQIPVALRGSARLDWQLARDTFSMQHLKGCEVSVLGDGYSRGRFTVDASTGLVTIDSAAVRVSLGLPVQADIKTLQVTAGEETMVGREKSIPSVKAQLLESRGLKAGRDFTHLFAAKERSTENYDTPARLQDGVITVAISTPWNTDGSICIRQDEPLPITITALIPEVVVGG